MNKRQKKKAFKKKYGFNPTPAGIENAAEAIRKYAEKITDLIPILCDAVSDAINGLLETIPELLTSAIKIINDNTELLEKEKKMRDLTELNKLEAYLRDEGIKYARFDKDDVPLDAEHPYCLIQCERHQIIVYDPSGEREWDAVCHRGSYGAEEGLLEIMGNIVQNYGDSVEGWLTADDVIELVENKKMMEGKNEA